MRCLVLDRVPADFHPDRHVALGPWCFFRAENVVPDWDQLPFVDAFPTGDEKSTADNATRGLVNELLDRIWPVMNLRHGTTYGRDYWHIVLTNWLLHAVQMSWRLYRHVECFVEKIGDEPLLVTLREATGPFRFSDSMQFMQAGFVPGEFHHSLSSQIVRRLAPPHWTLESSAPFVPSLPLAIPVAPRTYLPVDRVYGIWRWRWLLSAYVSLLPKKMKAPPPQPPSKPDDYFPAVYLDFVNELVDSTIPHSFTSEFSVRDAEAKKIPYRAGRLRVTTMNPSDDQAAFVHGHAVDSGERLVPSQHGGNYGWAGAMSISAESDYFNGAFITWGWTAQQDFAAKFVALPSPMLSRNLALRRSEGCDIVMVGHAMRAFNARTDFVPCSVAYRDSKRQFMEGLSPDAVEHLCYRPYNMEGTFEDDKWLRRFHPNLRIVEGPLEPVLFGSRLIVLDHPGTVLAVALSGNIPIVAFWDRRSWPLAPQAKALFAALERAEIVFPDPQSAVRQVNAIWPRVKEWWHEPHRQEARTVWCRNYAWAEKRWLLHWLKGLAQL